MITFNEVREIVKDSYLDFRKELDSEEENFDEIENDFNDCENMDDLLDLLDDAGWDRHRGEAHDYILDCLMNNDKIIYKK